MDKIRIHVLNFHNIISSIVLVLENVSQSPPTYYLITRWSTPRSDWSSEKKWFGSLMSQAGSIFRFEIEADPHEIVLSWLQYYFNPVIKPSLLGENCAVAVQRFLTHFANIPNTCLKTTWNHLALGILWPSVWPLVTLPGRVMDIVKFYEKQAFKSKEELEKYAEGNPYVQQTMNALVDIEEEGLLLKFSLLKDFYDTLKLIDHEKFLLESQGSTEAANSMERLITSLIEAARVYLTRLEPREFGVFKSTCLQSIDREKLHLCSSYKMYCLFKPLLAALRTGFFYFILACTQQKSDRNFLFFKSPDPLKRINHLVKILSCIELKVDAIGSEPLKILKA